MPAPIPGLTDIIEKIVEGKLSSDSSPFLNISNAYLRHTGKQLDPDQNRFQNEEISSLCTYVRLAQLNQQKALEERELKRVAHIPTLALPLTNPPDSNLFKTTIAVFNAEATRLSQVVSPSTRDQNEISDLVKAIEEIQEEHKKELNEDANRLVDNARKKRMKAWRQSSNDIFQANKAAEEKRAREAKASADAEAKRVAETEAEAEQKRLAEVKAEEKRLADAEAKRVAETEAEAEAKRLAEDEANRLAEAKRVADAKEKTAKEKTAKEKTAKEQTADDKHSTNSHNLFSNPQTELDTHVTTLSVELTGLQTQLNKINNDVDRTNDKDEQAQKLYRDLYKLVDNLEEKLNNLEQKTKNNSANSNLNWEKFNTFRTQTIRLKRDTKKEELSIRLLEFPYDNFKHFLDCLCKHPLQKSTLTPKDLKFFENYYARIVTDFTRVSGAPLDSGLRKKLNFDDYLEKTKQLSAELNTHLLNSPTSPNPNKRLLEELIILNESKIKRNITDGIEVKQHPNSVIAKEYNGYTLSFAKAEFPVEVIKRKDTTCNDLSILLKDKISQEITSSKTTTPSSGIAVGMKVNSSSTHRIMDEKSLNEVAIHALSKDAKGKANAGFANFYHTEKRNHISQIFAEKKEMRLAFHMAEALKVAAASFYFQVPGEVDDQGLRITDNAKLEQLRMDFFQNIIDQIQQRPYPYNQMTQENLLHILKIEMESNLTRSPDKQFYIYLGRDLWGRELGNFANILYKYVEQKITQAVTIPGKYMGTTDVKMPKNEYFDVAIRMLSSLIADSNNQGTLHFFNSQGNHQLLQAMRIVADANGIPYVDKTNYGFLPTTPQQIAAYGVLCTKVEFKQLRGDTAILQERAEKKVKEFSIGNWLSRTTEDTNAPTLDKLLKGETFIRPPVAEEAKAQKFNTTPRR